jgi:hypothetical protein|tara:strand:+ start:280 stop:489 length:210 start_codon:yes stop_codon:yes gene_type:complete
MCAYKQPCPIDEGWEVYTEMVKEHLMSVHPHATCQTHKDCHLNSFYPGKQYRAMKLKRNDDDILVIDKE